MQILQKQDVSFCQRRSQEVWGFLYFSCLFLIFLFPPILLPPHNFSSHGQGKSGGDGGGWDTAVRKGVQQAQEQKHLCTPWVSPCQRIPSSYCVSNVFGCFEQLKVFKIRGISHKILTASSLLFLITRACCFLGVMSLYRDQTCLAFHFL